MYRSSKSRFFFLFDLFHLVTWDDLDLYYGHKAQEMILTDVGDTIHADSLALFALNIDILLADVTKLEKSKILTLTWPVTSSVTSGSNFWPCTGSSRTGLSNGVWNLEIGPVVWEISGGGPLGPPPSRTCYYPDPSGARVNPAAAGPSAPPARRCGGQFFAPIFFLAISPQREGAGAPNLTNTCLDIWWMLC